MARGITESDVWKACDALLLAGARPTIERVRQHIGSGSPNTVGPHLDSWFKSLGPRITGEAARDMGPDMPAAVAEAAQQLWKQALEQTRSDFEIRVRNGLQDAIANVEAAKERAAHADAAAFDAVAKTNRLQTDLSALRSVLEQERLDRATVEAHLGQALSRIEEMTQQAERQRMQLQQAQDAYSADLAKAREAVIAADARADGASKRALLEIDQARQALLKAERQTDTLRREAGQALEQLRQAGLEHMESSLRQQALLDQAKIQIATLQQAAQSQQAALDDAQAQLQECSHASERHKAEAMALRPIVDRLSAAAAAATVAGSAPAKARKKAQKRQGSGELEP